MSTRNIALIGGKGFIGSFVADVFDKHEKNYRIYDKASESINDSLFDITDYGTFKNIEKPDVIINLAAEHRDDVQPISQYDLVNVQGAKNVCKYASELNINEIIFTSSVAVYGFADPNTDESGEINYFNDYGRTKFLAEEVYKSWFREDPINRKLVIIRPTVVFGEGNRGNVYNLMQQIIKNRFIMIGNGKNIKSMAYVRNVAEFINFSLNLDNKLHIYNYIDKPDLDMNSLIRLLRGVLKGKRSIGIRIPALIGIIAGHAADFISKLTGKKFPISLVRIKKFIKTTQFASSISNTDFKPPFALEEALIKTVNFEMNDD